MSAQSVEIFMFVLKDKRVLQSPDVRSVLVLFLGTWHLLSFTMGPLDSGPQREAGLSSKIFLFSSERNCLSVLIPAAIGIKHWEMERNFPSPILSYYQMMKL